MCDSSLHVRGSVLAARDSPPHGQRGRYPSRAAKSCAKLHADGVAKSCAKLRKQISRNHCPTRHTRLTRPTSPSAKREAQRLPTSPSPLRPPPRTSRCRRFASPRTRVRARGTDIGFSNKPRSCFLFIFLSFFCFFSFLRFLFWPCLAPFFGLCITRLRHPPPVKSGYKKSASFPTRLRLGFGVVVSWISPCFLA